MLCGFTCLFFAEKRSIGRIDSLENPVWSDSCVYNSHRPANRTVLILVWFIGGFEGVSRQNAMDHLAFADIFVSNGLLSRVLLAFSIACV